MRNILRSSLFKEKGYRWTVLLAGAVIALLGCQAREVPLSPGTATPAAVHRQSGGCAPVPIRCWVCLGKDKVFGQTNHAIILHYQVARLGHGQVAGLQISLQVQRTDGDGNRTSAGNGQSAGLGGDGAVVDNGGLDMSLAPDGLARRQGDGGA
jgi:hypothetical protein